MSKRSSTGTRGLYRDSKGRWCIDIRWREPGTGEWRRHRERLPATVPAAIAKTRTRTLLGAALAGGFDPKRGAPRRLGDALDEYVKWAEVNRPSTLRDRRSIATILKKHLGDPALDDVTPFHVERFKKSRRDEKTEPATINRNVAMLKHLCGLAVQWGWMRRDRADAIREMKMLKEPPGRVRYLTDDEGARLMAKLPARLHPIVTTALLSGMRLGELVSLRKDKVDLTRREITLVRTKTNRTRRVPINDALAQVLTATIAGSRCEFVFVNRRGEPFTDSAVKNGYAYAVRKAGIVDLHFHDLRHDFATSLRRRGAGLDVVAALLGHTTLQMASRYAHVGQDALHAAVASLPPPPTAIAQPLPNTPTAPRENQPHLRAVTPVR